MKKISGSFRFFITFLVALGFGPDAVPTAFAAANKCLFISSYHQGYAWSDGVERGLRATLRGKCEFKQFNMDTKRHKSIEDKKQAALKAKTLIESWQPDVVITADDNAAKYLILPYFKDADLPFVFNGINWTVEEYGFPFKNVTGMVEVAPVRQMMMEAFKITGLTASNTKRVAYYIGARTLTEEKNLTRFQMASKQIHLRLQHRLVDSMDEWLKAYTEAQAADFIILGSQSGIQDWASDYIIAALPSISKRLSITNHGWMMPFSMFGMTKIPEEQGEWSGLTALAILDGMSPEDIPIIANRKWDLWTNTFLLNQANISLPDNILDKAKQVKMR